MESNLRMNVIAKRWRKILCFYFKNRKKINDYMEKRYAYYLETYVIFQCFSVFLGEATYKGT